MFIPEYTITPNILKNIAAIEYSRSLIENSAILQTHEDRLVKDASINFIFNSYQFIGENLPAAEIKRQVDGLTSTKHQKVESLLAAMSVVKEIAQSQQLEEDSVRQIQVTATKNLIIRGQIGKYRSTKVRNKTSPEEILAEVGELIDWYNSLDAIETNTVVVAGILKAQLETIQPYEYFNFITSNLVSHTALLSRGYEIAKFTSIEGYYSDSKLEYERKLMSIVEEEGDFTTWLEYFTSGLSAQVATVAEKVKLHAKDTKLAKASGKLHLSTRQQRIVEYLEDYGMLQNKSFSVLFPNISEDSVLRDLKKLIEAGVVVKRGATKSSRYELK